MSSQSSRRGTISRESATLAPSPLVMSSRCSTTDEYVRPASGQANGDRSGPRSSTRYSTVAVADSSAGQISKRNRLGTIRDELDGERYVTSRGSRRMSSSRGSGTTHHREFSAEEIEDRSRPVISSRTSGALPRRGTNQFGSLITQTHHRSRRGSRLNNNPHGAPRDHYRSAYPADYRTPTSKAVDDDCARGDHRRCNNADQYHWDLSRK